MQQRSTIPYEGILPCWGLLEGRKHLFLPQDSILLPLQVNTDLHQWYQWCKSTLTSEVWFGPGMGFEFRGCCANKPSLSLTHSPPCPIFSPFHPPSSMFHPFSSPSPLCRFTVLALVDILCPLSHRRDQLQLMLVARSCTLIVSCLQQPESMLCQWNMHSTSIMCP